MTLWIFKNCPDDLSAPDRLLGGVNPVIVEADSRLSALIRVAECSAGEWRVEDFQLVNRSGDRFRASAVKTF